MKLQDYIHYYIGCPCIFYTADDDPAGYHTTIDYDTIKNWLANQEETDLKPLLRRLEDMTEEERTEIFGKDVHWYNPFDANDACDIQQWHKLLQKGFDLFGLIDAGLAIDAKTIN
jgi:hypothetical protein